VVVWEAFDLLIGTLGVSVNREMGQDGAPGFSQAFDNCQARAVVASWWWPKSTKYGVDNAQRRRRIIDCWNATCLPPACLLACVPACLVLPFPMHADSDGCMYYSHAVEVAGRGEALPYQAALPPLVSLPSDPILSVYGR
jgi:hypothetical protein